MRRILICHLLIFIIISGLSAQPLHLSFQTITQNEGLSDNLIHHFYQDSRGYLWISTNEGLNRFDGFTFRKYYSNDKPNSLRSNVIIQVTEYKPGYLLIGTANGLSCLNMITGFFEKINDSVVSTKSVNFIFKDKDGSIILGYQEGLAFLDSSLAITDFIKTSSSIYWPVMALNRLVTGELAVATTSGYYIADRKKKTLDRLRISGKDSLPRYPMSSYYDSAANVLYTSEWNNGLFRIDLNAGSVKHYLFSSGCSNCLPSNIIYAILRDRKNKIWIGTAAGLATIDPDTDIIKPVTHQKEVYEEGHLNMILEIFEDDANNIWIGTPSGIRKLNQKASEIQFYRNEFQIKGKGEYVNDILRSRDNKLIVSTYGNGIFELNEKTRETKNIGRSEMAFNWSLSRDGDTAVIVTGHGIKMYSYNLTTGKIRIHDFLKPFYGNSNLLLFSFQHSSGDKWYSMNERAGLVQYDKANKKFNHFTNKDVPQPFTEGYFSMAEEDSDGDIWFAVNRSSKLTCWEQRARKFKTIDFNRMTRNYNFGGICDITIKDSIIWVATAGSGVISYNRYKNTIITYTINDGLAGNVVNSLLIDKKNRLWAGTTKGLSCLLPGQRHFSSFGIADGLPQINFNERTRFYDEQKDRIYLGAENSLLSINPEDLLDDKGLKIMAYIDGIKVNGENLDFHNKWDHSLQYNENNIQFTFSVVDLLSSAGVNLYYQLSGADPNWIHAEDQRTASYINLPAGKYELRLKVSKSGSDYTSSTVPFQFEVRQAWWKTVWFLSLVAVALIIILYLIIRMYYRGKLEHQKMQFEKRQAVEQERTRIATDMHDDLGAGLTGIKFLSENISEEEIPPSARDGLKKLKTSANKLIESMGEIIWAMNEKNNSLQDLLFHLRSYSLLYCEENMMNCIFRLPDNISELIISGHSRRNIFLIIKECLHNIVKHAAAQNVNIDVKSEGSLIFRIQDDGKGFRPVESKGNGLINMQKRAKEMGGSFTIEDSGAGTLVTLRIPLR